MHRRLEEARGDAVRYRRLLAQLEVVIGELRKRVGQTFSLAELTRAYRDADRWARDAIAEEAPTPGWPRDLAVVTGAAFHVYARGAVDYVP